MELLSVNILVHFRLLSIEAEKQGNSKQIC